MEMFAITRGAMKAFIDAHKAHVPNVVCHWHREADGSGQTTSSVQRARLN